MCTTHLERVLFARRVGQRHYLPPRLHPAVFLRESPHVDERLFDVQPPRRAEEMAERLVERHLVAVFVGHFGVEIQVAAPQRHVQQTAGADHQHPPAITVRRVCDQASCAVFVQPAAERRANRIVRKVPVGGVRRRRGSIITITENTKRNEIVSDDSCPRTLQYRTQVGTQKDRDRRLEFTSVYAFVRYDTFPTSITL